MCRTTSVTCCLALLVAVVSGGTGTADGEKGSKLPAQIEPPFRWLPPDTETVIVTQGVRVSRLTIDERRDAPSFWDSAQSLSDSILWSLSDEFLWNELKGCRIVLAVEGSRHFRSPKDLGLMPYHGCQIIQFDEAAEDAVVNAFKASLKRAKRHEEIAGHQVALFQEKHDQQEWTILIAQPQRGMLLCATDHEYLAEVLRRMHGEFKDRALPESLPEWEYVNTAAAVWGVRHYKRENAAADPSSPLADYCAFGEHDGDAIGFVFWYDPEKDKRVELRYISKATKALKEMRDRWFSRDYEMVPEIEKIRPEVIRISYPTGKQDRRDVFLLLIMAYLGHGIYI